MALVSTLLIGAILSVTTVVHAASFSMRKFMGGGGSGGVAGIKEMRYVGNQSCPSGFSEIGMVRGHGANRLGATGILSGIMPTGRVDTTLGRFFYYYVQSTTWTIEFKLQSGSSNQTDIIGIPSRVGGAIGGTDLDWVFRVCVSD
jgi:hypothetical protein